MAVIELFFLIQGLCSPGYLDLYIDQAGLEVKRIYLFLSADINGVHHYTYL